MDRQFPLGMLEPLIDPGIEVEEIGGSLELESRLQERVIFLFPKLRKGAEIPDLSFVFHLWLLSADFLDQEFQQPVITRFLELQDGNLFAMMVEILTLKPDSFLGLRLSGDDLVDIGPGDDFRQLSFGRLGKGFFPDVPDSAGF
jgi:hypothetical protein